MTSTTVLRPNTPFDGVKVFSATKAAERELLGDRVTEWIAQSKDRDVVEMVVSQSSDSAFHCLAIWVFYASKK